MQIRRIEEAALAAWPALQHIFYDGWVLRFTNGYTKRANSVNGLYVSELELLPKIEVCEEAYQKRNLPPIFRITPLMQTDLDTVLEQRGYGSIDTTFVQYCSLSEMNHMDESSSKIKSVDLDEWMALFVQMSGAKLGDHETHRLMLETIPSSRLLAVLEVEHEVVACGLGVLEQGHMGFFDLVTHPEYRNRGYGTTLVHKMMQWGKGHGAVDGYLQVMQTNKPALQLYEKLGFKTVYTYWYRVPDN